MNAYAAELARVRGSAKRPQRHPARHAQLQHRRLARRRLPLDRTRRYNTIFTGGVYKASGWIRVGTTCGRGRYDTAKQYGKPLKDVWLCPLAKHWKRILNR